MAMFPICLLFSVFLSIPATLKAAIFIDDPPGKYSGFPSKFGIFQTCLNTLQKLMLIIFVGPDPVRRECRTLDTYTMVFSYFLSSSILFCFTMSFLFSLCIVGSPFLRDVIDREEYSQRYIFIYGFRKLLVKQFCKRNF